MGNKLYKYFEKIEHAENFAKGNLWFKSLKKLKESEDKARQDKKEGKIIHNPCSSYQEITVIYGKQQYHFPPNTKMPMEHDFVPSPEDEYVYCLCLSNSYSEHLRKKFGDVCISIDKESFLHLLEPVFKKECGIYDSGNNVIYCKNVCYYDESSSISVESAYKKIHTTGCFAKRKEFSDENEFRITIYRKGYKEERIEINIDSIANIAKIIAGKTNG